MFPFFPEAADDARPHRTSDCAASLNSFMHHLSRHLTCAAGTTNWVRAQKPQAAMDTHSVTTIQIASAP
jgi:hypothetical protein